ncbi:MAG: type IV pilus assembly protein PilM [Candidatus Portnoybacteria bacterium]|nr:type IV pilus assembly protein PilM [Candidatus Portnoybacteria bacterium]
MMDMKKTILLNLDNRISAFGIDISDFSIKIAKLKKRKKGFELESYNRSSIPKGIIEEGEIKDKKKLSDIVEKTVNTAKGKSIHSPYVVSSLPEQHGFVKIIRLPKMNLKEAKEAIKWEAEANIPHSLEDVYLTWKILPIDKKENHVDVLINAVPKEIVDSYLDVLSLAGLEPVVFEIESVATARSLMEDGYAKKPVLIIDLGASRTSFIIFSGREIRFTSSIPVSNYQMINDIAEKLDVDYEKAKELKFSIGLDKTKESGRVFNVLSLSMNALVDKIKDCIAFHKNHNYQDDCDDIYKVILCGGGAYLKGASDYLSQRLNVSVELGNPWVNVLKSKGKPPIIPYKDSLAYSTVLGLALRGADPDLDYL